MAASDHSERELEHAKWRVNFLTSMLQSHRALRNRDVRWQEKEAEYQERLKAAWLELERLRVAAEASPPPETEGGGDGG